ncbi:MAG: hypothetical protein IIB17_04730 [Chloroflexi bacterium]|nr:hypothetical protein [Chloroflexota bacterium]
MITRISPKHRAFGKQTLLIGSLLGFLVVTLPLWLPESVGGETAFNFILTGSMKGELDPGSMVILRRSDSYRTGDIAGYRLFRDDGKYIIIVHRIIGRLPDGRYIFKGDANLSAETVDADKLVGRVVFGIPWLGFIPGAIGASPILGGLVMMAPLLVRRSKNLKPSSRRGSLFVPALFLVALTAPFYSEGPAEYLGVTGAIALMLGFLVGTRVLDVMNPWPDSRIIISVAYGLTMALSMLMVSAPDLLDSARLLVAEFQAM